MKPLRQLLVGGALASAVVTVGCSEPTTLAREQPPAARRETSASDAPRDEESTMARKFRESAVRAAAAGDSQAVLALRAVDSIKRSILLDQQRAATRGRGSDGARRLGALEDAQANVPTSGWLARILATSTTPSVEPGGTEFYINSFVQFFGTHGSNQVKYSLSGNATGGAELPQQSGNSGGWMRCVSSISALAACSWIDSYSSVDQVSVSSSCGVTMQATALHRAWFALPQISFGLSGAGPSVSTNGTLNEIGQAGSATDAGGTASNGKCVTITMAETTAPSTRVSASISGSCQNAAWSSSSPTVAYLTTTAAGTATIEARQPGASTISVRCSDGGNGSKVLVVQSPDGTGGSGGTDGDKCTMYHVYLIYLDNGEIIAQLPDECLPYGFGTSSAMGRSVQEGMVALDLSRRAIQPVGPPPTRPNGMPACTASNPNICWAVLQDNPEFIDPESPWATPGRFLVAGGYNTAYPLTVTYRYNGKVVYSGTASDPYHIPDPPLVKLTGVVDGDEVVYSATVTDNKGVTLTTATNGWVVGSTTYGEALRRRELNRTLREAIRKGDKSALPKLIELRNQIKKDMLSRQPRKDGRN